MPLLARNAGEDLWALLHAEFARKKAATTSVRRGNQRLTVERDDDDDLEDERKYAKLHGHWMGRIAMALQQEYPGHGEMIRMAGIQGVIRIELPPLIVAPKGVLVNVVREADPVKTAVYFFGELLERFRLPRARFNAADLRAVVNGRTMIEARMSVVPE